MNKNTITKAVAMFAAAITATIPAATRADDAYVASTSGGNQAINTGYRVKSNTKLEVDFQIDSVVNSKYVFGAIGDAGTTCCLWANGNGNLEPNFGGWCGNIGGAATTTRRTIVYDLPNRSIALYEHGSSTPVATKDSSKVTDNGASNFPITLFANSADASGAATGFGICRIYSFKVWEGTTLVHDWTPAVKGGVVGFVDAVDGSFIGQSTPGADLVISGDYATLAADDNAPYIESDGTTVINSGVKPFPGLRVEIDYALATTAQSDVRIAGTTDGGEIFEFYVNQQDGIAYCVAKSWKSQYVGRVDTRRHTFIADVPANKCHFVTGISTNFSSSANAGGTSIDAEGSYPIGLFGRITASNGATDWAGGRSKARIYGVRFFKNGALVKNLVPCVKGDAAGFRDIIGGTFHTGEFNVGGLSAGGNVERIPDDGFIELCGNDQTQADALKGGHYIDTGYTPGANTRIELDFALAASRSGSGDWFLLSADNSSESIAIYQNANSFGACIGTSKWKGVGLPSQTNSVLVRRTIVLDSPNKAVTLTTAGYANYANTNDVFVAMAANASNTIKLGSTPGGGGGYTPVRIYGLKIYESGSLVREYVPFVKNGAPGLKYGDTFVKVSWNANLGAAGMPKAGGNIAVSADRDQDAFALFTGAQSLDTGYKPTPNMKLVADFAFANAHNKTQQFVFEATGNGTCRLYTANDGGANATYRYIFCSSWKTDSIGEIACDHQRRLITIDAPNNQMRFSPGATDGSTYNGDSTLAGWTKPSCSTTLKIASASSGTANYAKIRLYRFTIYDNGTKVREYVPCVAGGVAGLYDLVNGGDLLTANGLTVSGRGHEGAEEWILTPQGASLSDGDAKTFTARAVGAQRYVWTKDGEEIAGETGESLTVAWTRGDYVQHTYAVAPVYDVFGTETVGTAQSFSVKNNPCAFTIIMR